MRGLKPSSAAFAKYLGLLTFAWCATWSGALELPPPVGFAHFCMVRGLEPSPVPLPRTWDCLLLCGARPGAEAESCRQLHGFADFSWCGAWSLTLLPLELELLFS